MVKKKVEDHKILIQNTAFALGFICMIIIAISCWASSEYTRAHPDCKWSFADNCVFIFIGLTILFGIIAMCPEMLSIEGLIKAVLGIFIMAMIIGIILAIKGVILALAVQYGCLG